MISSYLNGQIEHSEEHLTRLKERIQDWRQRKEKLRAREKNIVSADMPIVAPNNVKPRQRDDKLVQIREEEKRIAAQMEQGRNTYRVLMNEHRQKMGRLTQTEAKLVQQIEAEKVHFDAQLEKLDAELAFVTSLLSLSQ